MDSAQGGGERAPGLPRLQTEVEVLRQVKQQQVEDMAGNPDWRERLRRDLENDISRRVREALDTPPGERQRRNRELARLRAAAQKEAQLAEFRKAARAFAAAASASEDAATSDVAGRSGDLADPPTWITSAAVAAEAARRRRLAAAAEVAAAAVADATDDSTESEDESAGAGAERPPLTASLMPRFSLRLGAEAMRQFGDLTAEERLRLFSNFTRDGFREAARTGRLPDGSALILQPDGRYRDQYGILRESHGPFWPRDFGPCHPAPMHRRLRSPGREPLLLPLKNPGSEPAVTFDNQRSQFTGRWRGTHIVYDSERSQRHCSPQPVAPDVCPSLAFESRFESGNLRQARRVGMFEYELVLRTDLYTKRHTQWFYFKVQNPVPGIVYKFVIVNLLKPTSLYGEGMKPLFYSEKAVLRDGLGWYRAGHHIRYARNATRLQSVLLQRDMAYYQLEWQMDFPHSEDSCYLAHCYPYTYSDLREDLLGLQRDEQRRRHAKEEVLCETRAGNSCFLLTVTDTGVPNDGKLGVVVTARVHPGEANSSWMMKGLIDFLTGDSQVAAALRRYFIFKIVPMLNPDGVIVGNYRTSLAGRDLNRNYRHPRKEAFPTVYHTKTMLEGFSRERPVALYCDLHGHSRKSNVFMYGCDSQYRGVDAQQVNSVKLRLQPEAFLNERLFPWLVSRCAPRLFSFRGCRFNIRRSKEATGRVVMWRQFQIVNSFTMEATFSGTSVADTDSRHFNTDDLESMGHSLASALWQYRQVREDKTRQSQVVVDMTFDLVIGMLGEHGVDVETELSIVDKRAAGESGPSELDDSSGKESVMQMLRAVLHPSQGKSSSLSFADAEAATRALRNVNARRLLDQLSLQTIDDCSGILKALSIDGADESDSSDSDSESEPEMPPASEPARRRKPGKRRDTQQGSREAEAVGSAVHRLSRNSVTGPTAAAATCGPAQADEASRWADPQDEDAEDSGADGRQAADRKKASSRRLEDRVKIKHYPMFVSKFVGRSNHGIPCFAEERLMERAKKFGDHSQPSQENRRDSLYTSPEAAKTLASLDNLRHRLQRLLLLDEQEGLGEGSDCDEIAAAASGAPSIADRMAAAARPFRGGLPPSKTLHSRPSLSNYSRALHPHVTFAVSLPAHGGSDYQQLLQPQLQQSQQQQVQPQQLAGYSRARPNNRLPQLRDRHGRHLP